jgi:lipopolysaccharide export system ATP-binding protein
MKLEAKNLLKIYYSKTVVNDVSLQVTEGEIVGLLGPNGAGKTTTFNMMLGLIKPNKGKILLNDADITNIPMYRRARQGIGYLPQEPSIFRKLTVSENLMAILETMDITQDERKARAENSMKEFGILHLKDQISLSLSGGEKRRCEIARALLTEPKFLLLDEPFVGIDPITINEIQGIIAMLKKKGIGILITDHNVRETLEVIDHAYIIYEGKMLLEGNSQELINSPKARRVYLGEKFHV